MSTATLSGWGQPHDALEIVAPGARHIDYAAQDSIEEALAHIAQMAANARFVIGWSMGAQMAVRAVAERLIAPKRLVLIAPPYQFVRSDALPIGLGRDTFAQYRDNLKRSPERTFRKSYALIAHGDAHAVGVNTRLSAPPPHNWNYWLDTMGGYSCTDLDMAHFPPTLLVHGENDAVIAPEQSHTFARALPDAQLHLWEGCGHAPHWHDTGRLRALIADHCA